MNNDMRLDSDRRVIPQFSAGPATSVEEVIERLTYIIDASKAEEARVGYLPALYRQVTTAIKQRIDDGNYFDDNKRTEKFDIIFANRYLTAITQMQSGSKPTQSWD